MTSEKEDEIIKIAHEAIEKHGGTTDAAVYIINYCGKKYG